MLGRVLTVICLLAGAASCGAASNKIQSRAAFDLDCPEAQVTVSEGQGCNYYARGCGKKAAYTAHAQNSDSMACCPPVGCIVELNGEVQSE